MSEISEKEFASAIKWIVIIVVAAIAYGKVAPHYYFMRQGNNIYRAHEVTGLVEYSDQGEWVSVVESETSKVLRSDRKKRAVARAKDLKKDLTEIAKASDDGDELDFYKYMDDLEEDISAKRYYH